MDTLLDFLTVAKNSQTLIKLIAPAAMTILFLQSGLDKVFHYNDNLSYFKDHFKNTPLSILAPFLLPTLTFLEVLAGIVCAIGTLSLFSGNTKWAFMGLMIAALSLLSLFFGQRMAKDYAGAGALMPYLVVVILGLLQLV